MAKIFKQKILLVDFELKKIKDTEEYLQKNGYEVILASDGLDALEKFAQEQPDIVILEAMLPKLHGFEVSKAIKKSEGGRDVPVIFLTGVYKSYKYKRQALTDYLADDYLLKPIKPKDLLAKIRTLLPADGSAPAKTDAPVEAEQAPETGREEEISAEEEEEELDFESLLNETLADLLKAPAGESEEVDQQQKQAYDDVIDDTLSGIIKEKKKEKAGPDMEEPSPAETVADERKTPSEPEVPERFIIEGHEEDEEIAEEIFEETEYDEEEGIPYGKYRLIEQIALGGMAELWKAKQRGVKGFEKIVAVKRLLPHIAQDSEFVKMFIDEGKLAAQLNHQNIAQIYELGEEDGTFYIAMEYIVGKDLKNILRKSKKESIPLTVEHSVYIAVKVCSAINYAHKKKNLEGRDLNIVHRDISPQNVIISYEGEIKLVDFGIAKAAAKDSVTQMGALKGKILYMSPEQAWGRAIDKRSDIFSMGSLLFEMLTGARLFWADNEMTILEKVRQADVEPTIEKYDNIPDELKNILLKALKADPNQRYQTAGDMKKDLHAFLFNRNVTPASYDLSLFMRQLFPEETEGIIEEVPDKTSWLEEEEEIPIEMEPVAVEVEEQQREEEKEEAPAPPAVEMKEEEEEEVEKAAEVSEEKQAEEEAEVKVEEEIDGQDIAAAPSAEEQKTAKDRETAEEFAGESEVSVSELDIEEEFNAEEEEEEEFDLEEILKPPKKPTFSDFLKSTPVLIGIAVVAAIIAVPILYDVLSQPEIPLPAAKTSSPRFLMDAGVEPFPAGMPPQLADAERIDAERIERPPVEKPQPEPRTQPRREPVPPTPVPRRPTPVRIADVVSDEEETEAISEMESLGPADELPDFQPRKSAAIDEEPQETAAEEIEPTAAPYKEPTPVPVKRGDLVELPDVPPRVKTQVKPQYPRSARALGYEGSVTLRLLISEKGDVLDVEALSVTGPPKSGFKEAAVKAIKRWKFEPARYKGVEVKTYYNVLIPFRHN